MYNYFNADIVSQLMEIGWFIEPFPGCWVLSWLLFSHLYHVSGTDLHTAPHVTLITVRGEVTAFQALMHVVHMAFQREPVVSLPAGCMWENLVYGALPHLPFSLDKLANTEKMIQQYACVTCVLFISV